VVMEIIWSQFGAGWASDSVDAQLLLPDGLQVGLDFPLPLCHYWCVHLLPACTSVRGVPKSQGKGRCGLQETCHPGNNVDKKQQLNNQPSIHPFVN
jgi:hypothetical protein